MQVEKEMELNKMRRSREGGGVGGELIVYRPGSHRQGSCYHRGMFTSLQKHKPAHFFLLNPEVIPPPRTPQLQFSVFPRWGYQQTTLKLEGLCFFFLLNDSILHAFKATFLYKPAPISHFRSQNHKQATPNTTREAVTVQESASVAPDFGSRGFEGDLD